MHWENESVSSASTSSTSSVHSTPTKRRRRPPPLFRRDPIGIDPDELIGKRLIRISRSSAHPALTLDFDDNTTAQVLVDGYHASTPGIPKSLEMDEGFLRLTANGTVDLEILDCAIIKLCDKAFQRKQSQDPNSIVRWDQEHAAIAFKFLGEDSWHCVWCTLAEYDRDEINSCVFRSYDDCYLDFLQRSPRKKSRKQNTF